MTNDARPSGFGPGAHSEDLTGAEMSTRMTTPTNATVVTPAWWSTMARLITSNRSAILGCLSVLTGFVLWELAAQLVVRDKLFLVAPSAIVLRLGDLIATGEIQKHILLR